ncbi:nucleoprotein TPR-like [Hibiscus syriacus]|uniref:nucleoprotein TPR-like n=1 Tax=Hibiscus syriacus TaxID=106335 RepID=UPI001921387C|nr:nucleoprotein TPR-like [Hibiscus syriacus]
MGCFLACFGSSKNRKNRKLRHKVQSPSQRNLVYSVQSTVSLEQSSLGTPIKEVRDDKAEEQLGSGSGKKVTFDTNVKTYEHVLVDGSTDFDLRNEEEGEKKLKVKEGEDLAKPRESENSSESSSSSYPPNHRYQNCRESDDEEDDELDYEESDLGDDEDDIEDYVGFNDEPKSIDFIRGGRDGDVHPVLKPVENLDQWKAVKSKGSTPLKQKKENLSLEQEEPRLSTSLTRSSKDRSFSFSEEVSVDASLSNWLSSRESTPAKKSITLAACTPERSVSPGSIAMKMSPEDRPILGALTLDDINKFSASPVPRRSPSRSPDEMPIIGTVGTYWNHESTTTTTTIKDSAASFKGIPNSTSKYREDKKVNWHSTPFEKRLERALNGGFEAQLQ